MGAPLDLSARINLKRTSVLVLDSNPQSLDLIKQILNGFGVRAVHACQHVRDAQRMPRVRHSFMLHCVVASRANDCNERLSMPLFVESALALREPRHEPMYTHK